MDTVSYTYTGQHTGAYSGCWLCQEWINRT